MNVSGKRVCLRSLERKDIDVLMKWENDPELWSISDTQRPFKRTEIEQFVNSSQNIFTQHQLRLMICDQNNLRQIGCIDLFEFSHVHQRAGVGILVYLQKDRKQGFGKESLELLAEYCKDQLKLKQLFCNVLENNLASIHLFENAGFQKIGLKKAWRIIGNCWENEWMLQKLLS